MQPRLPSAVIFLVVTIVSSSPVGLTAEPDKQKIQAAIQKGADYLIQVYKPGTAFPGYTYALGYASLAGMALLESGVDPKNPSLQNIIQLVRGCLQATSTYHVSLCIMFLDRLGDPFDRPFIQFLGARLLSGQKESGGWSYQNGTALSPVDEMRLRAAFKTGKSRPDEVTTARPKKTKPRDDLKDPGDPKKEPSRKEDSNSGGVSLHPEVGRIINQMQAPSSQPANSIAVLQADNSNTQFAILGLWCARRHGVPIEKAMLLVDKRFRKTQSGTGVWTYGAPNAASNAQSMTCAGLIGMAVSYGAAEIASKKVADPEVPKETRANLAEDSSVQSGFRALGGFLNQAKKLTDAQVRNGALNPAVGDLGRNLYFLWSLERVGVIFGKTTIGDVDWYSWGADQLVKTQTPEGSWKSNFAGSALELNASLGLLFLNRANVAKDLTAYLRGKARLGDSTLKSSSTIVPKDPSRKPVETNTITDPKVTKPGSDFDIQAAQLMEKVLSASGARRMEIVETLRDSKGAVYTEALKLSAGKLTGAAQAQVRESARPSPDTYEGFNPSRDARGSER